VVVDPNLSCRKHDTQHREIPILFYGFASFLFFIRYSCFVESFRGEMRRRGGRLINTSMSFDAFMAKASELIE
jgi:hypothetical protein